MRIGRRSAPEDSEAAESPHAEAGTAAPGGPFDITEVDVEERECVDLGSLLVTPVEPMELQLQVDEESGQVMAVVLVAERALKGQPGGADSGSEPRRACRPGGRAPAFSPVPARW